MADFRSMNKAELVAVGAMFAVDVDNSMSKEKILTELDENGVQYADYAALVKEAEEPEDEPELALLDDTPLEPVAQPEEEDDKDYVVVKMTRQNPTYETMGYKFTREAPFMLVTEEQAEVLIERHGGFEMARPKEIREFYAE